GGFTGPVSLSVSGLPSGASASFTPNPATTSSTFALTTSASTPDGAYALTIAADRGGSLAHTTTVSLVVTTPPDFTLSASPSSLAVALGGSTSPTRSSSDPGGFTGPVSLSVSGLPSGASGSFTPNPATTSSTSTFAVTTSGGTPDGTYALTIAGVSGGSLTHTTTVSLVVTTPPDFRLSASPSSLSVAPGGSTSYTVTINPTGGFSGPVSLSVSGLPSGASASFTPNPATTSSTFALTTSASTPDGTYALTIRSEERRGGTDSTTGSPVVTTPTDFRLSASPASHSMSAGGSTGYTVTITPTGGFSGPVSLSVSGLPSGASASFTPNPATTSSTFALTTSASTPDGTYALTI